MCDQLEIRMESSLSPREIQSRIRAGASPAQVAAAAGVPLEKIETYAVPILAEREYLAIEAQRNAVRRGADTLAGSLSSVISERLASRGIDPDSLEWDARRVANRKWEVKITYYSGKAAHEALFEYDQSGRFSIADNDEAKWLIGLRSASHGPQPTKRRPEESTVELNPDLALIRAVQSPIEAYAEADPEQEGFSDDASDDAYTPGVLAEVDGIYDYQPRSGSSVDVLYDMLSGLDEDSVKIYTGLLAEQNSEAVQPLTNAPIDFLPPESAPAQPMLVEPAPQAAEKPQPSKRRRAHVPSWDEIVFGSGSTPAS
ncbi:MAG: septation protein SepH [Propionibacteriaceae bacterium]|nr:septation protein SepH [Propionibacteriaceae bacterium]